MQGLEFPRPDAEVIRTLARASTATLQSILKRMGIHRIWMPLYPLEKGMTCVGPALTIRSVPGREDIAPTAYAPETLFPGHPDEAIEAIQPGDIVVLDGRGAMGEGLFGDDVLHLDARCDVQRRSSRGDLMGCVDVVKVPTRRDRVHRHERTRIGCSRIIHGEVAERGRDRVFAEAPRPEPDPVGLLEGVRRITGLVHERRVHQRRALYGRGFIAHLPIRPG